MKKLFSKLFMIGALGLFAVSCSDDEEIIVTPDDEFDVELTFSDALGSISNPVVEDYALTVGQTVVKARVRITASQNMRRVYITRNVAGAGDLPYTPGDLSNAVTKPDGSIDVETSPQSLDYSLNLEVPSGLGTNGTVVYKFWATSGKGDYRNPENSFRAGIGQIEVTQGTGANPNTPVRTYTATMLAAPLADGSSETFLSLLDGELYRVDQGEEYSALWDFGYYYGNTLKASLAAAGNYPTSIIDVQAVANTTDAELNSCFFQLSTTTVAEFDAVDVSGDLNFVTKSTTERINDLNEGDIVEFVDNYGKKGLIEVVSITPGFGTDGQMTINVKVQP